MRRVAVIAMVLALFADAVAAGGGRTPAPVIEPAAKGAQCVGDPDFMRRNHMDLLKHQRDDTVRQGVRGAAYSLKGCIECHASRETNSVARAPTNFCVSCHAYAAVKIDCFECHASQPRTKATAFHPVVPTGPGAAGAIRLAAMVKQLRSSEAAR
jgi:hypothetical protein